MAEKKVTTRKRSTTTTKRAKTTRTTTKRATKVKAAPRLTPVEYTPTIRRPELAEATAPVAVMATGDRPSRHTSDHYLHASGPQTAGVAVRRPGNWLIFVSRSRVDALWDTIRRAVESGRLGHGAKVSTALPDPMSPDPKKHVIAVYTADENDAVDVRRVRAALRQLGIGWKIPYKSDAATKYFE